MRAILFSKNEQKFDTYGLGEIDALKGNVTRERNGLYSIYLEYPADGPMSSIFEKEMKIKADAGVRTKNQTFEISRIVKDSTSIIKIYGYHISHKLEYMAVANGTSANGSARDALAIWSNALIGDYHFDTWSDIDSVGKTTFSVDKFENARQALGGVEGSILDIWGGEYEFDNMTIRLHKRLGRKAPTVLEYGRNILSAESDDSIEASYTSIYPFATYTPEGDSGQKDPVTVTIPEKYVDSKYISMYANRRIKVVDFSSKFKDKDIPTPEKLKNFASNYMTKNKIGAPKINTKIDYVDLASTLDYQDRKVIEELELCDIVPIYYPSIGITEDDAKATKIVYDFINERNESVEFGLIGTSIRSAMTSNVSERLDTLEGRQQALESDLPAYLLNAQGNKIWYDTPDNTKEHKIGDTWFEKNGLYERMYIWNGEMWEKIIDTEDVSRLKSEFDAEVEKITKSLSDQDKKTEEALKASGANTSVLAEVKQTLQQFDTDFASIRQNVEVNKKSVEDNLRGLTRRFEELTTATDSKLAEYAQTVDGRFTNFASQYVSKTDFQKVQETSKLYERILGSTENDLSTKVSRMVMSNQIFQTEVSKYTQTGPNLIQNSNDPQNTEGWGAWAPGENPTVNIGSSVNYYSGQKKFFTLTNGGNGMVPAASPRFRVKRNTTYTLNFKACNSLNLKGFTIYFLGRSASETQSYSVVQKLGAGKGFSTAEFVSRSYTFNSGEVDNAFLRFDNVGYTSGNSSFLNFTEIDLYEGEVQRPWQQSPEETDAISSKVTLLAGSYSIQNINSAADLISGLNLGANGINRLTGKLTHITNETILDNAVIKSAMVDKLKTANFESGSVTTPILASNSVTAEKLVVDQALFNKLTANEAYLKQLFAQSAFIAQVRSITLSATQILGGVLKALNNAMHINLNDGQVLFYTDQAALKRELKDYPTQFVKFATGVVDGNKKTGVTVIGSNRWGSENSNDGGFVGIRAWNGTNVDFLDVVGDVLSFSSSGYDNKDGWVMTTTGKLQLQPIRIQDRRESTISVGDVWLYLNTSDKYVSLHEVLQRMSNSIGALYEYRASHSEGHPAWWDTRSLVGRL